MIFVTVDVIVSVPSLSKLNVTPEGASSSFITHLCVAMSGLLTAIYNPRLILLVVLYRPVVISQIPRDRLIVSVDADAMYLYNFGIIG